MSIAEALSILCQNGYIVEQGSEGYYHYCKDNTESLYATETEVKDLARLLDQLRIAEDMGEAQVFDENAYWGAVDAGDCKHV